jgi:alcohol dehydrogenase (cytochrome c)
VRKLIAILFLLWAPSIFAQGLDPSALLKPPTDNWPTYNGDYTGRRFSPLSQINQSNVSSLTLAWAFQTHQQAMKSTPLEVNGILYFTVPNHVWAVDARIGKKLWDVVVADTTFGYYISMAPLVVHNHPIVGISGDQTDIKAFLDCRSPVDGHLIWRWYSTPSPGQPGASTWPNADTMAHGGGTTWMPGTYDPELNLIYWGTGNPHPVMAGQVRPGANLYTCSIVAINPDTGIMAWYFQASPHDTQDRDANETPIIFDAIFRGKPRNLLTQASRNGYFFLLDRATGENLLSVTYGPQNWSEGLDKRGEPIPNLKKQPQPSGALLDGMGTNWWAPSFDPVTGLFYVNAYRTIFVSYLSRDGSKATESDHQGATVSPLWSQAQLLAIDYKTGKIRWQRDSSPISGYGEDGPGILTTAGHLLISGDLSGDLDALDPATGRTLWHVYAGGRLTGCPMTYDLNGRQYLLTAVDSVLYAWALPASNKRAQ